MRSCFVLFSPSADVLYHKLCKGPALEACRLSAKRGFPWPESSNFGDMEEGRGGTVKPNLFETAFCSIAVLEFERGGILEGTFPEDLFMLR